MQITQSLTMPVAMRWQRECFRLDFADAVEMVREFHVRRVTQTSLAQRFRCSISAVNHIVWGRNHPGAYAIVKAELEAAKPAKRAKAVG
jgi:hypothetical protein